MTSQQQWRRDDGLIRLWDRVGMPFIGDVTNPFTGGGALERERVAVVEPPVSLEDYLIERRLRAGATTVDELTIRQALMTLGLTERAHRYPEWVRAEAWLFMALRIERQLLAVDLLARAHDLGLSQSSIEQARNRLRVVTFRHPGVRHGGWRWQLPPAVGEHSTPADIDPRWRRFQQYRSPAQA